MSAWPIQTQIALSNSNWSQWQLGLYSVSDRVTPWLAYQYSYGPLYARATTMQFQNLGGFKPEVQHLPPSKVRRCHHLVRPRHTSSFNPKIASPSPA